MLSPRITRRLIAQFTAQRVATQLGIGTTDLDCLLLLSDVGPAGAGPLAEVLGLTTGAVTGVVDRLVAAGFVVRETDPSDRRRVIVQAVADQTRRVDELFAPVLAESWERSAWESCSYAANAGVGMRPSSF